MRLSSFTSGHVLLVNHSTGSPDIGGGKRGKMSAESKEYEVGALSHPMKSVGSGGAKNTPLVHYKGGQIGVPRSPQYW